MNIPTFKQRHRMSCGPCALRMVLAYWGKKIPEREIIQEVGGLKKRGTLTIDNAQALRRYGFIVHCYTYNDKYTDRFAQLRQPSKQLLLSYLQKKIPVIIVVRSSLLYGKKPTSNGHYIVLTGHKKEVFYYNDPGDGKQHAISEDKLLFAWYPHAIASSAYMIAAWPMSKKIKGERVPKLFIEIPVPAKL